MSGANKLVPKLHATFAGLRRFDKSLEAPPRFPVRLRLGNRAAFAVSTALKAAAILLSAATRSGRRSKSSAGAPAGGGAGNAGKA